MKIDVQSGWFRGLGDIVVYAWIGQGLKEAGQEVEFWTDTPWRRDLLKMFGMKVTNDPTGKVVTNAGYQDAVKFNTHHNYAEWIAEKLGVTVPIARPKACIPPLDRHLGRDASGDVLIFPESVPKIRRWPANYFLELGMYLKQSNLKVRVVTQERDYRFLYLPVIYGKSLQFVSGAIQRARLVIGNDSGPAHLAGTLGTPTLAVQGSTRERIYDYLGGAVTSFRKHVLPCAGCHGLPEFQFRGSCEAGCHELYRTFPEDVYKKAIELLGINQQQKAA